MSTILSPSPVQKFFDNNGQPLANGQLFTYKAATSTKQATYIDSTGGTPNTNPIILDYRGECRLWIDPTLAYKYVLAPATDTDPPTNPIWSVDTITAFGTGVNFDNTAVDTGSVNAIAVSIPSISSPIAFTRIVVKVANTNTGATTITVNGGTAKAVTLENLAALTGGELVANGFYQFVFDGAEWILQSPALQPPQLRTAAEIAAGVTPVNYFVAPGNVLRYGSNTAPGTTDMTAAFNAAWLAYKTIYAPTVIYLVDTLTPPATVFYRSLYGDGIGRTILRQKTANNDVIRFVATGVNETTQEIRELSIEGLGSGTGNGINFPNNGVLAPSNVLISDVLITGMGGRGIYDTAGLFSTKIFRVQVDNCLDHAFDLNGGNTLTLDTCYAQRIPTSGKAGYRIHGGSPTLLGCNGVNPSGAGTAQYWGIFGDTIGEDGTTSFCKPTLIGCNVEDYQLVGIRNKNNGTNFINTTTPAPSSGTVTAYLQDQTNQAGFCDNIEMFKNTKGGSFANGQPIHTKANAAPFFFAGSANTSGPNFSYQFYNETDTNTYTVGCDNVDYIGGLRWAHIVGDFKSKSTLISTQFAMTHVALTYSASIAVNAAAGNEFTITATNGTAFTIQSPTNSFTGQRITITVSNASGGALGAITWSAYKMAAFTNPANGFSRSVDFRYDGANWVQVGQTGVDVPN